MVIERTKVDLKMREQTMDKIMNGSRGGFYPFKHSCCRMEEMRGGEDLGFEVS